MRVFLDTNVLVSALTARGLCAEIFENVLAKHVLLISVEMLRELDRVLTEKFGMPVAVKSGYLKLIRAQGELALPAHRLRASLPDPDDAPLVAAAIAGRADCFVTGDRPLLDLREIEDMPILSPRQFIERYRAVE